MLGALRTARGRRPEWGFISSERHADGVVHGIAADGERPDPSGRNGGGVGVVAGHVAGCTVAGKGADYSTRVSSHCETAGGYIQLGA